MNENDSDAQTKAVDSLLNFETVKYFGNEAHEARRFDESLARYERAAVKSQIALNALNLGQATIIAVGLALIMLLAAQGVRDGSMTVGRFVLVNTYLMQLYQPLNFLGFVYREIKQGLVDMEQMFRLLLSARKSRTARCARADASAGHRHLRERPFRLPPGPRDPQGCQASRSRPGGKLAIVGPTGAGKSTISRLLFRFYDVSQGRVSVDGTDVRDLTQESLRAAIGVVPQDTVLFNDTIRYNIAYGPPRRDPARDRGGGARRQVHDFVMRLPDGYGHARRRARPEALRRREAARRDRPHDPQEPAHPDPRRGDERARQPHRAGHPDRAARRLGQPHHAGHRAPALDRHRRRRDPGAAGRARGRARHACRAARPAATSTRGCGTCKRNNTTSRKRRRRNWLQTDGNGGQGVRMTRENHESDVPSELSHAGAVVDKAVEYMVGQNISSLAIASALLGGSLSLLARTLADEAIVQILNNAIESVQSGECGKRRRLRPLHPDQGALPPWTPTKGAAFGILFLGLEEGRPTRCCAVRVGRPLKTKQMC